MNIKGNIKTRSSVYSNGEECLGKTKVNGDTFAILLSKRSMGNGVLFADTLLHEFLHLWLFILSAATGMSISQEQHHTIISSIIKPAIRSIRKPYKLK